MSTINDSGLVNAYGEPIFSNIHHAAAPESGRRQYWNVLDRDSDRDITPWSLMTLRSHCRRCYFNFSPIRKSINDKADYAVSSAWSPVFKGKNKKWGEHAATLLTENWFPVCNVRGENFNWQKSLILESISVDRDGDIFIMLTETEEGYPQFQHVPAHRIGDRSALLDSKKRLKEGPYKGLKMINGVILNKGKRPVAFLVLGDSPDEDQFISAYNMIHVGEPDSCDNTRFLPQLSSAVNDLRDQIMIMGYEKQAAAIFSSLSLIEKKSGAKGVSVRDSRGRAMQGFGNVTANGSQAPGLVTEYMDGGATRHILSDEDVQAFIADRPAGGWSSLMDRLVRQAISSVWRFELAYDNSQLKGPGVRFSIMEARASIARRQNTLSNSARRRVQYAVAKFIKLGYLEADTEWWKWSFSMPATLSIDDGREQSAQQSNWSAGLVNATEILASRGKTPEDHYRERAREVALRKIAQLEAEKEYGIEIDDREMSMLTPNEPADTEAEDEEDDSLEVEDSEEGQPESEDLNEPIG